MNYNLGKYRNRRTSIPGIFLRKKKGATPQKAPVAMAEAKIYRALKEF